MPQVPVAARDLLADRAVCIINGQYTYPVTGHERPMFVTVLPANAGDPVAVTTYGAATGDDWTFDPGDPVFLGVAGHIIKTPNDKPIGVAADTGTVILRGNGA